MQIRTMIVGLAFVIFSNSVTLFVCSGFVNVRRAVSGIQTTIRSVRFGCPPNSYRGRGVYSCISCYANSTSPEGSRSASDCVCQDGFYFNEKMHDTTNSAQQGGGGIVHLFESSRKVGQQLEREVGKLQAQLAEATAKSAGKTQLGTAGVSAECRACPRDHYCPENGTKVPCPGGLSAFAGSYALSACTTVTLFPLISSAEQGENPVSKSKNFFSCYWDDELKFTFIHVPKNAGSSVINYMAELKCTLKGGSDCTNVDLGTKNAKYRMASAVVWGNQAVNSCPAPPSFFTFAFTRNPWDRALSMWTYGLKTRQLEVKLPPPSQSKNRSWTREDKEAALASARINVTKDYCTFDEFITMLETKNIWENIPQEKGRPKRVLRDCGKHWQDGQHALLYSEDNQSAAHFVGRVEFFDRDFTTVLKVVLNFVFESDRECETCHLRFVLCRE